MPNLMGVPQHACSMDKGFQRMGNDFSLLIQTSLLLASIKHVLGKGMKDSDYRKDSPNDN